MPFIPGLPLLGKRVCTSSVGGPFAHEPAREARAGMAIFSLVLGPHSTPRGESHGSSAPSGLHEWRRSPLLPLPSPGYWPSRRGSGKTSMPRATVMPAASFTQGCGDLVCGKTWSGELWLQHRLLTQKGCRFYDMPEGAQSWENKTGTKVPAGALTAPGSPHIWMHTRLFPGQGRGGRENEKETQGETERWSWALRRRLRGEDGWEESGKRSRD